MAIAHIQTTSRFDDDPHTSSALAFVSAVTAGSLLLCAISFQDDTGSRTITVTDSRSNTWHQAGTYMRDPTDGEMFACFYAWNASAGATTVTATPSAIESFARMVISEYSGILSTGDPLDQVAVRANVTTTTSASATASNSITPTSNGQLIWGALGDTSSGNTYTAGTGFTKRGNTDTSAGGPTYVEDFTQTTAAAITAKWTASGAGALVQLLVASFKPTGGGGASVARSRTLTPLAGQMTPLGG